jgi:hypothetical protein
MNNNHIGDPIQRYAAVNDIILQMGQQTCLDASYNSFIDEMKQVSWNESAAVGGWEIKFFLII